MQTPYTKLARTMPIICFFINVDRGISGVEVALKIKRRPIADIRDTRESESQSTFDWDLRDICISFLEFYVRSLRHAQGERTRVFSGLRLMKLCGT